MTAGIGGHGKNQKLWSLWDQDRDEVIYGQFTAEGVQRFLGANIAQSSTMNSQYPILQWVSGDLEEISFDARLWANDAGDFTVEQRLDRLEDLIRRNSDLERPPVCTFGWGDVASLVVDCLVRSMSEGFDEVRDDGTLRGVSIRISLARYEAVEFSPTDSSLPERMTRIRRARKGDTYERIALLEYGDPELGVLLRQLNPRLPGMPLADLNPKDPVHVYPEDFLLSKPIEPEFHAFKSGPGYEAAEERRREIFDARGGDTYSTIYPRSG